MDTTAGVHLQIMVKSDASPLRLSPVDILAHHARADLTAFDNAFVQVRKTLSVLSRFARALVSCLRPPECMTALTLKRNVVFRRGP